MQITDLAYAPLFVGLGQTEGPDAVEDEESRFLKVLSDFRNETHQGAIPKGYHRVDSLYKLWDGVMELGGCKAVRALLSLTQHPQNQISTLQWPKA